MLKACPDVNPVGVSPLNRDSTSHRRLLSYTRPCPPVAPLNILKLAPDGQRVCWEHPQSATAFVGFGAAAEFVADGENRFQALQAQLDALFADCINDGSAHAATSPKVFGGFSFRQGDAPEGIWSAFPSAYFVLPRYLLTRAAGATWLTINEVLENNADADRYFRLAREEHERLCSRFEHIPPSSPQLVDAFRLSYPLSLGAWRDQVRGAVEQIRRGELDKLVLSRTCDVQFDAPVNLAVALEKLKWRYPNAYHFLIEPQPGHAFFGATPELLIRREGTQISTAALAGSQRRGGSSAEDAQLAGELRASAKDRHEHQLVVTFLRETLSHYTRTLEAPNEPAIYRLSNIQHLFTPVTGELAADRSLLRLVEALHPTPALGGAPQRLAVDAIQRAEIVSRGWYAAPVGWIDAQGSGVFAGAIRSAVVAGSAARLYAGAGIVASSDPDKEWDETALKFKPMLEALGVTEYVRAQP